MCLDHVRLLVIQFFSCEFGHDCPLLLPLVTCVFIAQVDDFVLSLILLFVILFHKGPFPHNAEKDLLITPYEAERQQKTPSKQYE